jgi:DNA excision repair protein ERCC-4
MFVNGIGKLERSMKAMLLKSVYPWPRFHVRVMESIEASGSINLVELRISLTRSMKDIQAGLVDCLNEDAFFGIWSSLRII